jgi:decaprenylphospho-beta-D-erythro-pentofuranosid-2-ulose 2-reductase
VVLAGASSERLEADPAGGAGLRRRDEFDATEPHADAIAKAFSGGDVDVALVAFGLLGVTRPDGCRHRHQLAQVNHRGRRRRGGARRADECAGHGSIVAFVGGG